MPYTYHEEILEKSVIEFVPEDIITFLEALDFDYKNRETINKGNINEKYIHQLNLFYDAEIYYMDYYLGKLFYFLKSLNIYDDTNIILTADHGDELFDHGSFGHQGTVYDELIKIPFLIKIQNSSIQQKNIKQQVELIDIFLVEQLIGN
ncbi:hypothetical protein LCGC14_1886670 [marine sediment metagenome]|uniref:Sulfatase N-terminal domain-containing protein n=1 Tax=marine sediment metagenome TaxID=412755 RepID=A0A0F9IEJ9_9ZZZZ